jgi:hypothetical protein
MHPPSIHLLSFVVRLRTFGYSPAWNDHMLGGSIPVNCMLAQFKYKVLFKL